MSAFVGNVEVGSLDHVAARILAAAFERLLQSISDTFVQRNALLHDLRCGWPLRYRDNVHGLVDRAVCCKRADLQAVLSFAEEANLFLCRGAFNGLRQYFD